MWRLLQAEDSGVRPTSMNHGVGRCLVEELRVKQPSSGRGPGRYNVRKFKLNRTEDEISMTQRVFNFSAGPAVLPEPVLAEAQRDLMALPGVGASILEISHRSSTFENIIQQAETNIRQLLSIPDDYSMLFLQGGGRLMFSMIPMNLMGGGRRLSNYLITWFVEQICRAGGGEVRRGPRCLGRQGDELRPAACERGFEGGFEGGVFVLRVERNDSGCAVCQRAGGGRRAARVRCVERFFEPARGYAEVWCVLRVRTEECWARRV